MPYTCIERAKVDMINSSRLKLMFSTFICVFKKEKNVKKK